MRWTAESGEKSILSDQIDYYRARAGEYDEWFARGGRYDRGEAHRRCWLDEIATLEGALEAASPGGRCLETRLWNGALDAPSRAALRSCHGHRCIA